MNHISKLYLAKAENEFVAGKILNEVSINPKLQKEQFKLEENFTFYSSVISHCYYCIFYSAKAILLIENVKTNMPSVHQKTLIAFKNFLVNTGKLDKELLKIYEDIVIKADSLLHIFSIEKSKRGKFTYQTLPQANMEPAKQSLENANIFFRSIRKIVEKTNK